LSLNFLKGITDDQINLLMAATAWNLRKWLIAFLRLIYCWLKQGINYQEALDNDSTIYKGALFQG
jgi:hypothetical protein